MPKLRIVHVSGPRQGDVDELLRLPATIGSAPGSDVSVPGIEPLHARLLRQGDAVLVEDAGPGTYLAGEAVTEAPLRDGDVLELGSGGPRLRFEREEEAGIRLLHTGASLARRLAEATSPGFRIALGTALIAGGALFAWSYRETQRLRQEVVRLEGQVRAAEVERRRFEARIEEERRRAETERSSLEARIEESRAREEQLSRRLAEGALGEVQALRDELAKTRSRLGALEEERVVAERIIRDYGAGVCLIQGSYAFYDTAERPLRYVVDELGRPAQAPDGSTQLSVEGTGPVHTMDYFGTGFLVDRRGLILTNRHVAEPWWKDNEAQSLVGSGFRPRFVHLRAFFPRIQEAVRLEVQRRSETMDLAVMRAELGTRKVPVLPLDVPGLGAVPGQPVVVVGYPTGLEAILAKTESKLVEELLESLGMSPERVTEALSKRGLIRPSTTQGHIGDVTRSDIVFDAPTTQGGSGAPVFNRAGRVVAVEYAVLQRFGGNAFGVPIHHALELLKEPKR